MAFLVERDRQELQTLFQQLEKNVRLIHFTRFESQVEGQGSEKCETCDDTRRLLEELASISEKVELEVHDFDAETPLAKQYGVDRVPALIISSEVAKGRARYFGIPAGYEFSTIVGAILDASKGTTDLRQQTKETVATIHKDVHIQVFVTPT
jgi:alkyl hydroperoxide reductase subunit AhpF